MATVGLVSCVSRKQAHACKARDLYASPLFEKSREYAQRNYDKWFILSAKHGLVAPDDVVDPYEETLNDKPVSERRNWAGKVWAQLGPQLRRGDRVVVLAGEKYREFLLPMITRHGCMVQAPMQGLGIGRQLQWLKANSAKPSREHHLEVLYEILRKLEAGLGGKRLMSECTGKCGWPRSGVYFFFEPGELRTCSDEAPVVRVGTHGVSRGSKATLWKRLRTHRGTSKGLGNHRGSIFRLHVRTALAARNPNLAVPSWGRRQTAPPEVRLNEESLERAVSVHIGMMSLLWLPVLDDASPFSDRAYLERNLIGLLVGKPGPVHQPSPEWLGLSSPDARIRDSGVWNLNFLDFQYSPDFLAVLGEYVCVTIGQLPQPTKSIAPPNWYLASSPSA